MKKIEIALYAIVIGLAGLTSCTNSKKEVHVDKPFDQEYCVKYNLELENVSLKKVCTNREGYIQVHSSNGLLRTKAGEHLFPGSLVKDVQYLPTSEKKIANIGVYKLNLMYVDDEAVFSNGWAGKIFYQHQLPKANVFAVDNDFGVLVSDGSTIKLLKETVLWEGSSKEPVIDIKYDSKGDLFWVLDRTGISSFSAKDKKIERKIENIAPTCFEIFEDKLIVGTSLGYVEYSTKDGKAIGELQTKLPCVEITSIKEIDGTVWFGTTRGAFKANKTAKKFDYYASRRWMPSDKVVDIAKGPENSVLILTDKGLSKIVTTKMTLAEKAELFEKQVRERHLRHGFNATVSGMKDGDVTSGRLEDSDNDGLWTSMYLAGEAFRYAVTKSDESLENVRQSLDAMERLYTVNGLNSGFPSRSFERHGYSLYDKDRWREAPDKEWDWKSTTSSDEAIGHIFAFGAIAELVPEPEINKKAIMLIDTLMSHIVKNKYYLIDWNGQPTSWGRWNPEYVNGHPVNVGDRKLNSSNIIGMLQTAYHFTKKEKYKEAALDLMNNHGYLENMMRPMSSIGNAGNEAGELSKELSDAWNHSDDEMYYCGYWGLYRYALNDELKEKYRASIIDHWEAERPEKEGLWNIMTALANVNQIDLENAIWYLQEYPLDLIGWNVENSHRKDIEFLAPNFRNQTIKEVLSPKELSIRKHNSNCFGLDGGDKHSPGVSESSAGDIWLLPYWMGRYFGVIVE